VLVVLLFSQTPLNDPNIVTDSNNYINRKRGAWSGETCRWAHPHTEWAL